MPLEAWLKKSLLEFVEKTNKPREEINLLEVCAKAENIFGVSAGPRRRAVQGHWNNLKRRSIRSYTDLLDKHKVAYSATTAQSLLSQGRAASPASSAASPAASENDSDNPLPVPPATTTSNLPTAGLNLPTAGLSSPELTSAFRSLSFRSPVSLASPSINRSLQFSLPKAARTMSTPELPSWATSSSSASKATSEASFEGSRSNPYVINVDTRWPERHREFDVEYADRIQHGEYVRQGYHIRSNVSVADAGQYEATMVKGNGLDDRAVLIKGPCRSSWHAEVEDYHRRSGFCENTKELHTNTVDAIKMDEARWFHYWLLIFPEEVVLDNVILSGDPIHVTMGRIGVHKDIGGTECRSSFVYWRIAKREGGFRKKQAKKESISDMFA
jgi:hypothetical protein